MPHIILSIILLSLTACTASTPADDAVVQELQEKVATLEQQLAEAETPKKEPSTPKQSYISQNIECRKYGEEHYSDRDFDDGYTTFEFFYSPVLDTCIGEREDFGPGVALSFGLFDMFKEYWNAWIIKTNNWCEGKDCVSSEEYQKKKAEILGE